MIKRNDEHAEIDCGDFTDYEEIVNIMLSAQILAEKLDDLLRHAEFHGSAANARSLMEDVSACILGDLEDAKIMTHSE